MSEIADRAQALHADLVGGDPIAPAKLAELVVPEIISHLTFQYSEQDEHLRRDAAADAVMEYLTNPSKYDPSKSKLLTYLKNAAVSDIKNLLAKQSRRDKYVELIDPVELSRFDGNKEIEGRSDPVLEEVREDAAREELEAFIYENFGDDVDRELARLVTDDVRKTSEYVSVLGVDGMDEVSQRAEVKRQKDRIKAKLKRAQRAKRDDD